MRINPKSFGEIWEHELVSQSGMAKKFYAVKAGYTPGIYSYEVACQQIKGFSKPEWKGFNVKKDAEEYLGLKTTVKSKEVKPKTTVAPKAQPKAQPIQKSQPKTQPAQKQASQKQPVQKSQGLQMSQPVQKEAVQKVQPKPTPPPPKLTPAEQADNDLISARDTIEAAKKEVAEAEAVVRQKQKSLQVARDKARTIMSEQAQKFKQAEKYYVCVPVNTAFNDHEWNVLGYNHYRVLGFETLLSRSKEAAKTAVYLN